MCAVTGVARSNTWRLRIAAKSSGSLRFFENGVEHGPGYPAGSVTGPVALGAQMRFNDEDGPNAARLLPDAEWPAGHAP